MWSDKILPKFRGSDFYGVEVLFDGDHKKYFVVKCSNKKGNLSLEKSLVFSTFKDLKEALSNSIPVVLCFTGNGIINKKVKKEPNYKSKVLFNSKLEDFYWFEFFQGNDVLLSIARTSLVDEVLFAFKNEKFQVLQVNLGVFIANVFQEITALPTIATNKTVLEYKEGMLTDFQEKEVLDINYFEIGGQEVSNEFTLGFASVIHYLLPSSQVKNTIADLQIEEEEYLFKNAISKIGVPFVIGLFVLLILSFLATNYYTNKINELSVSSDSWKHSYEKVTILKKDKLQKEAIFRKSGIANNRFLSFYVWSMLKVLPKQIQLSALNVFPLKQKIEKGKQVNFINDLIEVKGKISKNIYLSNWIRDLKSYDWISNIEIVDFRKEKGSNAFEIRIKLNHDR